MVEFLWVGAVLAVMAALSLVPADALVLGGLGLAALGLIGGSCAGFVYHLRLRTALAATGSIPRDWWLFPVRQHQRLNPAQLATFAPWFTLGALGFIVAIAGCILAMGGLVKSLVLPS